MLYLIIVLIFIFLNIVCDVNYFIRSYLTVLSVKFQSRRNLLDATTIYGIGTFQDCDVSFQYVRSARIIRELDIARYHHYELTDIYRRSCEMGIRSLQGCTLTVMIEPLPVFEPYKIDTKLVYWDDCSAFLEHEVVTLCDGKRRYFFLSRQHALSDSGDSTEALFKNLPGADMKPSCPQYIQEWLKSMEVTSLKLRNINVQKDM